ncbi:ultraviolet-B receptor UVR8-like [Neltuma alba]|uniref:ultraviolet-B receptor UVR8-like n=1 Tax=Neltuma alba TaxID=207710 RepID=UPI0010A3B450|nr:ultraviolet-B receptor UVR8-like [Prosopis alba]
MKDAANFPNSGNLSSKVVAVAAGEAHTLASTGDGCVYSWGRGILGRLGRGSEEDEFFPVQVKFENPSSSGDTIKIVGIAAGAYHSLALADDGSVWCWGYNIYGQLGLNEEDSYGSSGDKSLIPCLLNKFLELHPPDSSTDPPEEESKASLKICSVKAGGMMSLAIDNLGALWMWGNCPQKSNEGGFSLVSSFVPTPVWDFHGHTVVKVACGNEHVVALVTAGESYVGEDLVCYSWGNNSHGQLGLGDRESRPHPEVVKAFDQESPWAIYEVACGAFHTALLTHKKSPSDTSASMCWTFGLGDNGQLGHGTTQSELLPMPVKELPQHVHLISVDCGLFHTSVISSAGDVWSWGMEKGLGLCPDASFAGTDSGDALSPLLISCTPHQPRFPEPIQVACGAAHTVVVAQEGYKIWSWGRGRSGVLGNGKAVDFYTPTLVLWPPLIEDFKQEDQKSTGDQDKMTEKEAEAVTEMDEKLASALNELKLLQTRLSVMERYASILHGSIFGKPFDERDIPASLKNSGVFDIAKEWESMLEEADRSKLIRLEMFYKNMLAGVKDKLMKRRIKEIIKECLQSSEFPKLNPE